MKRFIPLALGLSLFSATSALAQHPTPKVSPQADSTITALMGTWEGSVFSDHAPETALKMIFTKSPEFGVAVSIRSGSQEFADGPATDMKVDGNGANWNQGLMQTTCKASAQLIAGALKGEFNCGAGSVTFLAKKK